MYSIKVLFLVKYIPYLIFMKDTKYGICPSYVITSKAIKSTFKTETNIYIFFLLYPGSRDSSVGIATGWTAWVRLQAGTRNFLFFTASRSTLRLTQPPIQWVPGALSPMIKRQGREADHSELRMAYQYLHSIIRLYSVVLN
jgi:hypothetical protein